MQRVRSVSSLGTGGEYPNDLLALAIHLASLLNVVYSFLYRPFTSSAQPRNVDSPPQMDFDFANDTCPTVLAAIQARASVLFLAGAGAVRDICGQATITLALGILLVLYARYFAVLPVVFRKSNILYRVGLLAGSGDQKLAASAEIVEPTGTRQEAAMDLMATCLHSSPVTESTSSSGVALTLPASAPEHVVLKPTQVLVDPPSDPPTTSREWSPRLASATLRIRTNYRPTLPTPPSTKAKPLLPTDLIPAATTQSSSQQRQRMTVQIARNLLQSGASHVASEAELRVIHKWAGDVALEGETRTRAEEDDRGYVAIELDDLGGLEAEPEREMDKALKRQKMWRGSRWGGLIKN